MISTDPSGCVRRECDFVQCVDAGGGGGNSNDDVPGKSETNTNTNTNINTGTGTETDERSFLEKLLRFIIGKIEIVNENVDEIIDIGVFSIENGEGLSMSELNGNDPDLYFSFDINEKTIELIVQKMIGEIEASIGFGTDHIGLCITFDRITVQVVANLNDIEICIHYNYDGYYRFNRIKLNRSTFEILRDTIKYVSKDSSSFKSFSLPIIGCTTTALILIFSMSGGSKGNFLTKDGLSMFLRY